MAALDYPGNGLQGLEQRFAFSLKKVHLISLMMIMMAAFSVNNLGKACSHTVLHIRQTVENPWKACEGSLNKVSAWFGGKA